MREPGERPHHELYLAERDVHEGAHEAGVELRPRTARELGAASSGRRALYDRADVITSYTSAIATMRPASGISSPATPRG